MIDVSVTLRLATAGLDAAAQHWLADAIEVALPGTLPTFLDSATLLVAATVDGWEPVDRPAFRPGPYLETYWFDWSLPSLWEKKVGWGPCGGRQTLPAFPVGEEGCSRAVIEPVTYPAADKIKEEA